MAKHMKAKSGTRKTKIITVHGALTPTVQETDFTFLDPRAIGLEVPDSLARS